MVSPIVVRATVKEEITFFPLSEKVEQGFTVVTKYHSYFGWHTTPRLCFDTSAATDRCVVIESPWGTGVGPPSTISNEREVSKDSGPLLPDKKWTPATRDGNRPSSLCCRRSWGRCTRVPHLPPSKPDYSFHVQTDPLRLSRRMEAPSDSYSPSTRVTGDPTVGKLLSLCDYPWFPRRFPFKNGVRPGFQGH